MNKAQPFLNNETKTQLLHKRTEKLPDAFYVYQNLNIPIRQSTNSRCSLNTFVVHSLVIALHVHLVLAVSGCWAEKWRYHTRLGCAMADAGGPRESWHGMHCKIEELAADAILNHVEQHWRKVTL